MTKYLNLFATTLTGLCALGLLYMGFNDIKVHAWAALIWCFLVFIQDLGAYFDGRSNK